VADAYARLSVKSQTVIPKRVREHLRLAPGDRLRFVIGKNGVRIEKASDTDDPFVTFSEWSGREDEEAYADL
jgi:antitoxin PrlF